MKIAFSTLGCPDFSWSDIYSMAKDLGFDGIEIRGLGNEIFAVKAQPFTAEQLPHTVKKMAELRLEVPCLSSGCCLKFPERAEQNYHEIVEYITLAAQLGTPYIRVLADLEPQPGGEVDDEVVLAALMRLVPVAEANGVTLLIETNGVYSDTARLCKLLDHVPSDAVAALWDAHHPYRYAGETPQ
ncbi:MAG TPA: TIM barrel protein, partial [Bacillota bacterium]|nr:TIM barrel protein [Bacillota bacterium]